MDEEKIFKIFGDVKLMLNYHDWEKVKDSQYPLLITQLSDGDMVELTIDEAVWLRDNLDAYIKLLKS